MMKRKILLKPRKILSFLLASMLAGIILLTSCSKENGKEEPQTEEAAKNGEIRSEIESLNLRNFTDLEVITDYAKFTPASQDQSYNPETDMNLSCLPSKRIADAGDIVYMCQPKGGLIAFQKETASAALACNKADCSHDVKNINTGCQANLRILDAEIGGMQYYNGSFYYTLASGASILYKTSSDHEIKSQFVMLLGEKGAGVCSAWIIHRGYIYFFVERDGLYRIPVDNPSEKERLLNITDGKILLDNLLAEGSFIYFTLRGEHGFAAAKYNVESNAIEQFTDMEMPFDTIIIVHNGKIYYTNHSENSMEIYQCDTMTGENKIFLKEELEENMYASFQILHADSDYLYVRKNIYGTGTDYYSGAEMTNIISYLAYTWEGIPAGDIKNTDNFSLSGEFRNNIEEELIGSDSDRIYYLSREWDEQVQEKGALEKTVEGSEKTVISYLNKSELSTESTTAAMPVTCYVAGEIYD